ncbi:alpha/beta fold hydrolase [Longispora sp. K20-0274]|uniref:alpha/beta fold hydrolase n=1 Tax=Longispora sp. K20-0274 TaxID=3088255 RepID=UPI00399B4E82
MPELMINNSSLAYAVEGTGPAVLLLHSGIADHRMWDALVPALAGRRTVIRPDLRGYGASPAPTEPFGHVADVVALLDHLGVDRVDVVGSSNGGRIAVNLTAARPDLVATLTLLAAAPVAGLGPGPEDGAEPGSAPAGHVWSAELLAYSAAEDAALEAGDVEEAVRLNVDVWLRGPHRSETPAALAVLDGPLRTSLRNQAATDRHVLGAPAPDLAAIAVPTVVGYGDRDVADFEAIARRYAARIPGARLVAFPGAGHMIPVEQPDEVLAALPF